MSSDAYVSRDGKELVLAVEGFAMTMFDSESAKSAISDAFALAKITDGRASVRIVEKKAGSNQTSSLIDELDSLI